MTYEEAMRYAEHWILSADMASMNPHREADATLAQAYIAYARELREANPQNFAMLHLQQDHKHQPPHNQHQSGR